MDSQTIVTIAYEYDRRFNAEYWHVVSLDLQTETMKYICINDLGHVISRFTLSPRRFMYKRTLRILFRPVSLDGLHCPSVESVPLCRRAALREMSRIHRNNI